MASKASKKVSKKVFKKGMKKGWVKSHAGNAGNPPEVPLNNNNYNCPNRDKDRTGTRTGHITAP